MDHPVIILLRRYRLKRKCRTSKFKIKTLQEYLKEDLKTKAKLNLANTKANFRFLSTCKTCTLEQRWIDNGTAVQKKKVEGRY